MSYVFDTNVVLYLFADRLSEPLPKGPAAVSVVSAIELLSFQYLTTEEAAKIETFLATVEVVDLGRDLRDEAVRFRRDYKLKLPDAIIAATANAQGAVLLTHDARLAQIPELKTLTPTLREKF